MRALKSVSVSLMDSFISSFCFSIASIFSANSCWRAYVGFGIGEAAEDRKVLPEIPKKKTGKVEKLSPPQYPEPGSNRHRGEPIGV